MNISQQTLKKDNMVEIELVVMIKEEFVRAQTLPFYPRKHSKVGIKLTYKTLAFTLYSL